MKHVKTFESYIVESEKIQYSKQYFIDNKPEHIENGDYWKKAVDIATKNGKDKSDYGAVTAIYNNVEKKQTEKKKESRKDWTEVKSIPYWKKMIDGTNMNSKQRKYFNDILKKIEDNDNMMSPNQKEELNRLKNGILKEK